MNYQKDYTKHATIRPVVLATSTSRYGRCDFPQGRKAGITLVTSDCQLLFKVANKDVLFSATNNVDGTVTLNNPAGFLSLTIAGPEVVRLAKKAKMDVDEIFLTHDELLEMHEEPTSDTFTAPILADASDLADFASVSLGTYFTPLTATPEEATDEADELAAFFSALPVTPAVATPKPALTESEADELAEALSPTQKPAQDIDISRKLPNGKWQRQRRGSRHPRPRRKGPAPRRITRKGPAKPRAPMYTQAHQQQDIALLWG
jgi:hypothetical protein